MDLQFEHADSLKARLSDSLIDAQMLSEDQLARLVSILTDVNAEAAERERMLCALAPIREIADKNEERDQSIYGVQSIAEELSTSADEYASTFEQKLLRFDFSPTDAKQTAIEYYAFIERENSLMSSLASLSDDASELYEKYETALESINFLLCDERLFDISARLKGECFQNSDVPNVLHTLRAAIGESIRRIANAMTLSSDLSDAYARFTIESEPLIMSKAPSVKKIGTAVMKYASSLHRAINKT